MPSDNPPAAAAPRPSVFLSYATQDRVAARALQDAMSSFGLDVWLDESELGGGEAWDQKIRKQIRECQFFMPLISAQTEARLEGYFRREWRLAVERSLDMADDHLFLLPILIDDTDQATARVPEKFHAVQWLKVPQGRPTPALEALCRRIASGATAPEAARGKAATPPRTVGSTRASSLPAFPQRGEGGKLPYWLATLAWTGQAVWAGFQRLPRWVRALAYVWLFIAALSSLGPKGRPDTEEISSANAEKIKDIAEQYQGNLNKGDIAKLGAQIARAFDDEEEGNTPKKAQLLAIPFLAPPADAPAAKFADSAFAMVYGRLALSHRGHLALSDEVLPATELGAALERAQKQHAAYVLFGAVESADAKPVLNINLATVQDKSILWKKSYPLAGADAGRIAAEVDTKVPALED